MTDSTKFWDKIARKYAKRPIKDMASYDLTMERTRAHLDRGHKVLELGCGTGTTALRLADSARHILATDVSPAMIEIGQEKAQAAGTDRVSFLVAGVDDPRLTQAGTDRVLAFNLLHLLPDLNSALTRINAMLAPGGLLISKTICLGDKGRALRWLVRIMQLVGIAPYVNFITIAALETALERAGFEIIETGTFPASPPSRFVVARKR